MSHNLDSSKELFSRSKLLSPNIMKPFQRETELPEAAYYEKKSKTDICASVSSYKLKRERLTSSNNSQLPDTTRNYSPQMKLLVHLPILKNSRPNTNMRSRTSTREGSRIENLTRDQESGDNNEIDTNHIRTSYDNSYHKHKTRSGLTKPLPILQLQIYKSYVSNIRSM